MYQRTIAIVGALFLAIGALAATVDVRGAVTEPQAIEFEPGMRVRHAIDAAGGFAADADRNAVRVVKADGRTVRVNLSKVGPTPLLAEGDVIEVIEYDPQNYVHVVGAVAKPGSIEYREGITVGEALGAASPFDAVSAEKVKIVGEDGVKKMPSDMSAEDLYALTLGAGETVHVSYPGQQLSNQTLLLIIVIVLLIVIVAD